LVYPPREKKKQNGVTDVERKGGKKKRKIKTPAQGCPHTTLKGDSGKGEKGPTTPFKKKRKKSS